MEESNQFNERRNYPRSLIDLPLEYRVVDVPYAHGGFVVNVSETVALIYSAEKMPVGLKLNIAVFFPNGYELSHFDGSGEIIWKDSLFREGSERYVYGIRFLQTLKEDRWKLTEPLKSPVESEEIFSNPLLLQETFCSSLRSSIFKISYQNIMKHYNLRK